MATAELQQLRRVARRIPDESLRHEALSSIANKDFHVYGGAILATFLPSRLAREYVSLVTAFETAVDYLDNLCDRAGSGNEADLRALHESLIDALAPGTSCRDYFRHRTHDDGGYLVELVRRSQQGFDGLPGYDAVAPFIRRVTSRYCELQALKHLAPGTREQRCRNTFSDVAADLSWWEGAAACGSTLPTFALIFAAMEKCETDRAQELYAAYFPYVSAFHILLDAFIDQVEDREHKELNLLEPSGSREAAVHTLVRLGRLALVNSQQTNDPHRHAFAVRAMCAFYCSRIDQANPPLAADARNIAAAVDVTLDGATSGRRTLAPLLALYQRVTGA